MSRAPGIDDFDRAPDEAYLEDDQQHRSRSNGHDPVAADVQPIDWSKLTGDPPPRTWWVQDWLGPWPTLTAGAGGIGKSRLLQALGTSIAVEREYLGAVAADLRVLIWSCEEPLEEIWRTQVAINAHFGIAMSDLTDRLHVVSRVGFDNTMFATAYGEPMFTPLVDVLRQQINDLHIDVFVIDNLAQVYGCNPSDQHQTTTFVNGIAGLVRGRPFCPIFIGHVARSVGSEFSGSAAWENAVRMRWYLGTTLPDQKTDDTEPVEPDLVYLAKRKANYTAKDWRRLRFRNGLLVPEEIEGRRFDQKASLETAETVVLSALAKLIAMGTHPTDGRTSSDYLPTQIASKRLGQGFTKAEITAAMHRLMTAGRLKRAVVGKYSNRVDRVGLVLS